MTTQGKSIGLYLWGSVLIGGILPLIVYWPSFNQSVPQEPLRGVATFEQWLVVITAFGVKPLYMLLSLVWIICLWRRQATDLLALRWGMILFLGGEIACATNYLVFDGKSAVADYFHSYGMAVGFSFVAYAFLEGMDLRLMRYSAVKDRCAALGLCRSCAKYADVPCGCRRLALFFLPALVVLTFLLPCAALNPVSYQVAILGSVQNFSNPMWSQLFESRYCAWVSLSLFLISWLVLLFKRNNSMAVAKVLLAAGMGPLGFGIMRLFLRSAYSQDLAWANIWEEITELLFVSGVGLVLWMFRHSFFQQEREGGIEFEGRVARSAI